MGGSDVTPDSTVFWESGMLTLNLTIVCTWIVMAILIVGCWMITRRLESGTRMSRWQNGLEVVVDFSRDQIEEIAGEDPDRFLTLVGTLFVFIVTANVLAVVPGFVPPTASLSTTAALALIVFLAVPVYGIAAVGWKNYLAGYLRPNPLMLPFNLISELSRTLALAVRLFGNVMSFAKIAVILLAVAPLVFPALLNALGLLTGVVQAYIFAVLAIVYIAAARQSTTAAAGPASATDVDSTAHAPSAQRKDH